MRDEQHRTLKRAKRLLEDVERSGSAIWRLPELLAEQPVVTVAYVAEKLGITPRAASTLVARACEYAILRPLGTKRRGDCCQSDALIGLLEEISDMPGIRRVLARGKRR